jgi:hypothetical protein
VGLLYQAKADAQRAADAAALAAARLISISGVTGDPNNSSGSWQLTCGAAGTATLAATAVAQSPANVVGGVPAANVKVTYGPGAGSNDCSTLAGPGSTFSVNPTVNVYVQQANLPTFFGRIFSLISGGTSKNSGVSATATAEVYNPSGSGSLGSGMVPVQPRCVKPWIIPNIDPTPGHAAGFVSNTTGAISSAGIYPNGVIGESFPMNGDCTAATAGGCTPLVNPPAPLGGVLLYVPALVQNTSSAVPSCLADPASDYQQAIAGCDQTTVYACGTPLGAQVDLLNENPVHPTPATGDTATSVQCLTNLSPGLGPGGPADTLEAATYPFQIQAGSSNPLVTQGVVASNSLITTSNSIVTIPIYDNNGTRLVGQQQVTIIGFLQVFINSVDTLGNINVTVMNVSGCSNAATAQPVNGSSPVPVRLITPP